MAVVDAPSVAQEMDRHTLAKGEDWWWCTGCGETLVAVWAVDSAAEQEFKEHLAQKVAEASVGSVLRMLVDEAAAEMADAHNHWTNGDSELELAHYKDMLSVHGWLSNRMRKETGRG